MCFFTHFNNESRDAKIDLLYRIAVYFWTVYSLGLRMQEGLNLQVGDIDAERAMVHVHRGKGAKDRYVRLPTSTLEMLRQYWTTLPHSRLFFPADGRDNTLRTLRHSCATHLLEAVVSLKAIQKYMGRSSLQTTMIYLHLTETAECSELARHGGKLFRPPQYADQCLQSQVG